MRFLPEVLGGGRGAGGGGGGGGPADQASVEGSLGRVRQSDEPENSSKVTRFRKQAKVTFPLIAPELLILLYIKRIRYKCTGSTESKRSLPEKRIRYTNVPTIESKRLSWTQC